MEHHRLRDGSSTVASEDLLDPPGVPVPRTALVPPREPPAGRRPPRHRRVHVRVHAHPDPRAHAQPDVRAERVGEPAHVRRRALGARAWTPVLSIAETLLGIGTALLLHAPTAVVLGTALAVVGHLPRWRHPVRLTLSAFDDTPRLVVGLTSALGVVVIARGDLHVGEEGALRTGAAVLAVAATQLALRTVCYAAVRRHRRRRGNGLATLVIGGGTVGARFSRTLLENPHYGLQPVGTVDDRAPFLDTPPTPWLGPVEDVTRLVHRHDVRVLVIAYGLREDEHLVNLLRDPGLEDTEIYWLPRLWELHTARADGDLVNALPLERFRRPSRDRTGRRVKRVVDVVLSGTALLLLSPVMLVCGLLARRETGDGAIFRQVRIGVDGRPVTVMKFRSLSVAPTESDTTWNIAGDLRVGPVGKFLRRSSLDELPQLLNVLRGQMSLVGPRPERPVFVEQFAAQYPRYWHRHRVPCGLTGWAQVNGLRGNTSIELRADYDNYYIENFSLWFDLKILLATVSQVLRGSGG
ncbi:sugar transferase [Kineococcus sp. SYSU DK001]|uniref:sugar transferase n=1 Tax=Kineococcus sp. SYSU DK001 TaxID=3383122 RepID=UPI003D7ED0FE